MVRKKITSNMIPIETIPKPPTKIVHAYQAGEIFGLQSIGGDVEIKTKEKTFKTSIFPFLQTDHLFDQIIGLAITVRPKKYTVGLKNVQIIAI